MSAPRVQKLLAYVGVPAAFCAAGYLLLWIALIPVWDVAMATLSFLVSDEAPQFDADLFCTYDPDALKPDGDVIDGKDIQFPLSGEQYGLIQCERIGLDAPVYWYDEDEILAYGVGQSLISKLPGFNKPIILSGHNTTFFKCLQDIQTGDVVQFHTNYCDYEYTVTNVQVYNENELETLLLDKAMGDREELIMYTCYPFHAITGRKTDRLVVFADRTVGKDVKWKEES